MKTSYIDGVITIELSGRIDSTNAPQIEKEVMEAVSTVSDPNINFNAENLIYISSVGLRILLKVKRAHRGEIRILNVSDEVFDILNVTGFDNLFKIERQMRKLSIKNCRKIGSAINGDLYQLSDDEMIKVYAKEIPLDDIKLEREYAQTAMIYGVPTLIPYDVVQCDDRHGVIYEKAEMTSLAYILSHKNGSMQRLAEMFGHLMKELHSTEIPEGSLPDIKDRYREWIRRLDVSKGGDAANFANLIDTIKDSPNYVHGDINLNNVMVHNDELFLLDMAGSSRGHALFDLQSLYASLVALEEKQPGYCRATFGVSGNVCREFWDLFINAYMNDKPQEVSAMNVVLKKYFILKESVIMKLEQRYKA